MKRIKEEFLDKVEGVITLSGKNILEIGCGAGARSIQIAQRGLRLTAIEPDPELIIRAQKENFRENIEYQVGKAEVLEFGDEEFDMVIFTLSLHHVPLDKMDTAIGEAIRVTKRGGHIVFLEPTEEGSFFEGEIKFDACDGDERQEKKSAYTAMLAHGGYELVKEIPDETVFQIDSIEDFRASLTPKQNLENLADFLKEHNFILNAKRRINIFKV